MKRLSKENYSKTAIKNKLKEEDIVFYISAITHSLENVGIRRQALSEKKPVPKFNRQSIKRTVAMVTKVMSLAGKKNPGSYRLIQKQTGLTLYTG